MCLPISNSELAPGGGAESRRDKRNAFNRISIILTYANKLRSGYPLMGINKMYPFYGLQMSFCCRLHFANLH